MTIKSNLFEIMQFLAKTKICCFHINILISFVTTSFLSKVTMKPGFVMHSHILSVS